MRISWGYWNDFCDRLAIGEITGSHHFRPIGQPCLSVHVRQGRLAKPTFAITAAIRTSAASVAV